MQPLAHLAVIWAAVFVNVSLMCALAMTATAVSLTMVSLRSKGLQDSVVAIKAGKAILFVGLFVREGRKITANPVVSRT